MASSMTLSLEAARRSPRRCCRCGDRVWCGSRHAVPGAIRRAMPMIRPEPSGERLAANVAHFARLLRRAGLRVGPGDTLDAERAVAAVDIVQREQFYWALHAVLVRRHADHALFD